MNGWWKFHRAMLDHPVWKLPHAQRSVWISILTKVNHTNKDWFDGVQRVELGPGEMITSQEHLAEMAGTTRQVVRDTLTALLRLGTIGTKTRTKRYTQITVVNWHLYQGEEADENQEENHKRTKREPSENQARTIAGECKKERMKEEEILVGQAPRIDVNGFRSKALSVLTWLNEKSRRNYRPSPTNLDLIVNRLKDGIADWQLRAIVTRKCREWDTDEMRQYLRPATLFNKTKCEQYLGELPREDSHGLS
jgi:uncharacterized phage protein (TIGR02220 family)